MTFSIVIMVGRGYFLPTHVHEASMKLMKTSMPGFGGPVAGLISDMP